MKKPNSTVILNFRSRLVNNYLAKGFCMIENYSKQNSMLPNDVKLIIHLIDKMDTDFVMTKNKAISSVAITIKKFHIQENMHLVYKQDFYKDRKRK